MYDTVSDEFILSTIAGYRQEIVLIEGKIEAIRQSLSDDTDLIRAASLPARDPEETGGKRAAFHDIGDVYEKYMALARKQRKDCIAYVTQLMEKKDSMDRVMASYQTLPPKEYRLLEVYSRKIRSCGKCRAIEETKRALYISDRTAQRTRKQALSDIRRLYESDRSLLDLQMEAVDAERERAMADACMA